MPDDKSLIKCGTHGSRTPAVVCCHQVNIRDRIVGFVENSSDPDDLQAWCDECEQLFLQEEEMTEAFREFNDFKVVCDFCYAQIKERNTNFDGMLG
jgi:hypothetical protein